MCTNRMNHPTVTPKNAYWSSGQVANVCKDVLNLYDLRIHESGPSVLVYRDLTQVEKDVLVSRMGNVSFSSLDTGATRITPIN